MGDGKIIWYENDDSQGFTEHLIHTNWGVTDLFAVDIDSDGDMDILSSTFYDAIWLYENDGNGAFTVNVVTNNVDYSNSVYAADVDGDGDIDILSASINDNMIAWYDNDGNQVFTQKVISTNANKARYVYAADIDGDGDMDVLSASDAVNDDKIAWYEQEGSSLFAPATKEELQSAVELWVSDNATALATYGEINTWAVSLMTDMSNLFYGKLDFNSDISKINS